MKSAMKSNKSPVLGCPYFIQLSEPPTINMMLTLMTFSKDKLTNFTTSTPKNGPPEFY